MHTLSIYYYRNTISSAAGWHYPLSRFSPLNIACSSNPLNHISFVPAFYISSSTDLSLYPNFCSFYSAPHALLYRLNNPIDIGRWFWKLQARIDAQSLRACLIISAVIVGNCGAVDLRLPHLLSAGCFTGRERKLPWVFASLFEFTLSTLLNRKWAIFQLQELCWKKKKLFIFLHFNSRLYLRLGFSLSRIMTQRR